MIAETGPRIFTEQGYDSHLMNRGAGLALIRAGDQGYAGVDFSDLVPCGFVVESAMRDDSGFVIAIRGAMRGRRCPACRSSYYAQLIVILLNIRYAQRKFPL